MRLLTLALCLFSFSATASDKLGLGIALGSPIGVHYFYELESDKRIEGAVGSSLSAKGTHVDSHYVTTKKNHLKLQAYELDLNYGYGLRLVSGDNLKVGPSGLLGVDHELEGTHFSILANSGAAFLVGDGISLDINLYLGANYRF